MACFFLLKTDGTCFYSGSNLYQLTIRKGLTGSLLLTQYFFWIIQFRLPGMLQVSIFCPSGIIPGWVCHSRLP
ncbi:hypothetical protein A8C56_23635 [Niabella ginsenosidivorans]|uniref:Uncharacterized protein n=1 Tax=Niabella ginsenosidivorans TaxID=1176587 RepID=A0A1A9I897_9BACT|nr:hypothetical protein A8C56_23635 [Niabella ginsenosidivorans]